ncbi:MAG: PaaI family thioesterase [Alphaproteobacteria bacterium]|nr:PaaI family thioesterase [Alphaproteobacteria bacterium]
MKRSVTKKQYNSRMCFVCGLENNFGLHASFYETDSNELVAIVTPSEQHQSYPGRMHGGLAATILDETIGRAIANGKEDQVWGVTLELTTKYRKPIPLGVELRIVGRVSRDDHRFFEGSGEILLPDGSVAVSAAGKYMKVPIDKITSSPMDAGDWFLIGNPDDPREIEIP